MGEILDQTGGMGAMVAPEGMEMVTIGLVMVETAGTVKMGVEKGAMVEMGRTDLQVMEEMEEMALGMRLAVMEATEEIRKLGVAVMVEMVATLMGMRVGVTGAVGVTGDSVVEEGGLTVLADATEQPVGRENASEVRRL